MTVWRNTGKSTPLATAVSVANSGGAAGDPFGTATNNGPTHGSMVWDNTHGHSCDRCIKWTQDASGAQMFVQFSPWTASANIAAQIYIWLDGSPPGTWPIFDVRSGATTRARIRINTARKIEIVDSLSGVSTGATALQTGAFTRLDLYGTVGTSTRLDVDRFDSADSSSVSENVNRTNNFGGTADRVLIGSTAVIGAYTFYTADEAVANENTRIAPFVPKGSFMPFFAAA